MKTPELDKMKLRMPETQAASDFLDWLYDQGFELAHRPQGKTFLQPVMEGKDSLLYRWIGVDPREAEKERKDILDNFLKTQKDTHD